MQSHVILHRDLQYVMNLFVSSTVKDDYAVVIKTYGVFDVDESCAVLGYYAAQNGKSLPTFQDNLSVPSSRSRNPRNPVIPYRRFGTRTRSLCKNSHSTLRNIPEQHRSFRFL